jgi:hypothetical protein
MFEVFGLLIIKCVGHGWLWGKGDRVTADDVFGNGGRLLEIGLGGFVVLVALGVVVLSRLG